MNMPVPSRKTREGTAAAKPLLAMDFVEAHRFVDRAAVKSVDDVSQHANGRRRIQKIEDKVE